MLGLVQMEKFGYLTVKVMANRSPMNLYRVPIGRICLLTWEKVPAGRMRGQSSGIGEY